MSPQLLCCWGSSQKGSEEQAWDTPLGQMGPEGLGVQALAVFPVVVDQPLKQQACRSLPGQYPAVQMGEGNVWRSSQTIKTNLSLLCCLPSVRSLPAPRSACQALVAKSLGTSCSNKTYWNELELNFCPIPWMSKKSKDVCQRGHWNHSLG